MYIAGMFDVAVIGAGHAGIEAGVASAKLGAKTVVFTMNLDSVGNCPCNPSIGGTAKGHLVKEIDAMGGVMGKVADKCCLQSRMLNRGKGEAVHSLRMQIDRNKYRSEMKHILETQENLFLKQAEIVDISLVNQEKKFFNKDNLGKNFNLNKTNYVEGLNENNVVDFTERLNQNCAENSVFSAGELNACKDAERFINAQENVVSCSKFSSDSKTHYINASGSAMRCSNPSCNVSRCINAAMDVVRCSSISGNAMYSPNVVGNVALSFVSASSQGEHQKGNVVSLNGVKEKSNLLKTGQSLSQKGAVDSTSFVNEPVACVGAVCGFNAPGNVAQSFVSAGQNLKRNGNIYFLEDQANDSNLSKQNIINDDSGTGTENLEDKNNLFGDYVWKVTTRLNSVYLVKAVVITTGTYLNSKIFVGESNYSSGPDGLFPSAFLSDSLKKLGVKLLRFKTGTPARVLKSSINFSCLKEQKGDEEVAFFSTYDENKNEVKNKVSCHITWTNEKTKDIILKNIHRSPVYSGDIKGTGPRYCPSIEDKIVRFKDKERHQLFIEPCGENTEEMYLQGMSSGLPLEVQEQFYRTIEGLEKVSIMRPAYAIEYDCADPIQLDETLEFKNIKNLFGAGQFNGSSGYEEAAAQGLIAGVNAALKIKGKEKIVLKRSNSYIGTLIDDLVTKGVKEPYRMMTARSEYRLLLRQDNVYERLSPIAKELGLISEEKFKKISLDINKKNLELKRLKKTIVAPSKEVNDFLVSRETSKIDSGVSLLDLLKRPQLSYKDLAVIDSNRLPVESYVIQQIETEVKYAGYISRQEDEIKELQRLENKKLPIDIDYLKIDSLRLEAREKLNKFKPSNIGMASRIAGVNPADVTALLVWLARQKYKN